MIALPYEFDSSALWRRIVKIVFTLAGLLLLATVACLASGRFGGATGLAIAFAILCLIVRRVRDFPMGAAGRLNATDVETREVKVLWYSLPVPVGRFSIDRFQSIAVVEHVVMPRATGSGTNTGRVLLVGKAGTPDIAVAFTDIDQAIEIARELGNVLGLKWQRLDAPGSRTIRVTLN